MLPCKHNKSGSLLLVSHDAATSASQGTQHEGWGGLWTATNAETFAANSVHLYTCEVKWHLCQDRGFELLESLYNKAERLKTVQVRCCCLKTVLSVSMM